MGHTCWAPGSTSKEILISDENGLALLPTHFMLLNWSFTPKNILEMAGPQYFTQAGLDKLKDEVHELKTNGRKMIAQAIAEAREKGDLKENAEYDAAKHEQGLHEAEIARLEGVLANARLIDESQLDTSKALILATVKLRNLANDALMKYTLVSQQEADFKAGRISVDSPVGKALLGKSVGEFAEVSAPAGSMKLEILEISY